MPDSTRFEAAEAFFALIDRLTELPEDPDEIAQVMKAEGIKGRCLNPRKCALAEFAVKEIDPDSPLTLVVYGDNIHLTYENDITFVWDLPEHLELFTKRFDHGDYPEITDGTPTFQGTTPATANE